MASYIIVFAFEQGEIKKLYPNIQKQLTEIHTFEKIGGVFTPSDCRFFSDNVCILSTIFTLQQVKTSLNNILKINNQSDKYFIFKMQDIKDGIDENAIFSNNVPENFVNFVKKQKGNDRYNIACSWTDVTRVKNAIKPTPANSY